MKNFQEEIFLGQEGNNWYSRNKSAILSKEKYFETEFITNTLIKYKNEINKILEIGCGNGAKLNILRHAFCANGKGVDPSSVAVSEGNELFGGEGSGFALEVGTANSLNFNENQFDLVYFGFCLYLVDRRNIFKAIAEADRVLKSGGFMAIFDFDPGKNSKNEYHHSKGVYSYKNSYADFFIASGHYYLVAKASVCHQDTSFSKDPEERVSLTILYKEDNPY